MDTSLFNLRLAWQVVKSIGALIICCWDVKLLDKQVKLHGQKLV